MDFPLFGNSSLCQIPHTLEPKYVNRTCFGLFGALRVLDHIMHHGQEFEDRASLCTWALPFELARVVLQPGQAPNRQFCS